MKIILILSFALIGILLSDFYFSYMSLVERRRRELRYLRRHFISKLELDDSSYIQFPEIRGIRPDKPSDKNLRKCMYKSMDITNRPVKKPCFFDVG